MDNKLSDYILRVCIYHEKKIHKIFALWYTSDGGYFIKWLCKKPNHKYLISKINFKPSVPIGEVQLVKEDKEHTYTTSCLDPKITHHIDGKCHISGPWIMSWYNTDGSPKWIFVKSWTLKGPNDWWPMFVFNIWLENMPFLPEIDIQDKSLDKKYHLILNEEILVDRRKSNEETYNYLIEWYYLHKSKLPDYMSDWVLYIKEHPLYGLFPLMPVHSPSQCPYIFAIWYIREPTIWSDLNTFSYAWAPGLGQENWSRDNLGMILVPNSTADKKNIDYIKEL